MIKEYDIVEIFREMETDLVNSMIKQIRHHLREESIESINWSQWQTEMLSGLNEFRKNNADIVGRYDERTISNLEVLLKQTYTQAGLEQEREILEGIVKGAKVKPSKSINDRLKNVKGKDLKEKASNTIKHNGSFFKVNDKKLNALIKESKEPLRDSFKSILRYQDDEYRKIIFKAQVYANTGVKTVRQAVDMASKEYLQKGISHITYKDGKKVSIVSYAELVIKNSNKKAQLSAQGQVCDDYNNYHVLISQYSKCSPKCIDWQNKILFNDVFGNGDPKDAGEYELLSTAMNGGKNLFHINCKHTMSPYFIGINTRQKTLDKTETLEHNKLEQHQRALERKVRAQERLKNGTLDPIQKKKYELEWVKSKNELNKFVKEHNDILRRDPWRESSLVNTYKAVEDIPELRKSEPTPIDKIIKEMELKKPVTERLKDKNIFIEGRFGFDGEGNKEYLLEQIDDLSNKYKLNNKLTLRSRYSDSDVAAYHEHSKDMSTNRINLNKRIFNNFDFLEAIEEACEDRGWCVKGADKSQLRRKTLSHEFGHLIERELVNSNFKLDQTSPYFFNEYDRLCKDLMYEFKELFKTEIGRELNMRQDLSTYAMTNAKEFFAESFCKMECNPDDDIAKVMNIFLRKYNMIND